MNPESNNSSPMAANPGQVVSPGSTVSLQTPSIPPNFSPAANDRPMAVAGQPINTGQTPSVSQPVGLTPNDKPKNNWPRLPKGLLIPIVIAVVLLGGSAAAYFGYFVPNKPDNVWRSALKNSGKGYDKLSGYAQKQFAGQEKGLKLDGSFKLSGTVAADGSFKGSSDSDNGEFSGSVSATGLKVNFDTRIIKSTSGNTPDIYFKVDGLQGLGSLFGGADPQIESSLNGLNGNWYFIDHSFFDQYAKGTNSDLQFSQTDVKSVLDAVGAAAKQNIFTGNPSRMAFSVKQNIGKEKQDGRNVYHYKVGVNKTNLKSFVTTLCSNLKNSSLKKFFNNDSQAFSDTTGCSTASKSVDNFKTSRTADVWVDLRTKLIHKVRFIDPDNSGNYFDIGQDYQGGDSFPFNLGFQSRSGGQNSSGSLDITLNTKLNTLILKGSAREDGQGGQSGSLNMTISPNNSPVKVDKPTNAKSMIELLNDLGFGDIFAQSQTTAKDTERKTDINALVGHIEANYSDTGYYPSLADLNNSAWRSKNMVGLDLDAFKDPDGTTTNLAAKPGAKVYSYEAIPVGCDNIKTHCTDYTLTATLDNGSPYIKQSLNSGSDDLPTLLQ